MKIRICLELRYSDFGFLKPKQVNKEGVEEIPYSLEFTKRDGTLRGPGLNFVFYFFFFAARFSRISPR